MRDRDPAQGPGREAPCPSRLAVRPRSARLRDVPLPSGVRRFLQIQREGERIPMEGDLTEADGG